MQGMLVDTCAMIEEFPAFEVNHTLGRRTWAWTGGESQQKMEA